MALLAMDGHDLGDHAARYTVSGTVTASTDTRFTEGRSLSVSGNSSSVDLTIPATSELYLGFALKVSGDHAVDFIALYTGVTKQVSLRWDTTTSLGLYRGGTSSSGTQLATATVAMPTSHVHFEMRALIADSGGRVVVKINGSTVIDFTGDTQEHASTSTVSTISRQGSTFSTRYFDDFWVCDTTGSAPYNTFLGDARVRTLVPTAAGSSTQFTPSTGSNWSCVDELPYSDTDYVASATSGHTDTYTTSDVPSGVASVLAVQVHGVALKTDSGAMSVKGAVKSGATTYAGSAVALATTATTFLDLRTTDPNTASAWTVSGVNALEVGVQVA